MCISEQNIFRIVCIYIAYTGSAHCRQNTRYNMQMCAEKLMCIVIDVCRVQDEKVSGIYTLILLLIKKKNCITVTNTEKH